MHGDALGVFAVRAPFFQIVALMTACRVRETYIAGGLTLWK